MKIILNGNNIKTIDELHKELKIKLELPDYYGENLDALWDCLTGWIDLPTTIVWGNYEECKKYLGEEAEKVLEIFYEAQEEINGFKIELI